MRPTTIELVGWPSGGAFVGAAIQLVTDSILASALVVLVLALGMLAGDLIWKHIASRGGRA